MTEILSQALQDAINFIKNVSPILWETLVRQVYNDAITYLFWALVLTIGATVLFKLGKKLYNDRDSEMEMLGGLSYCGTVILSIIVPVLISTGIRMLINPNYYAIYSIINMITGK